MKYSRFAFAISKKTPLRTSFYIRTNGEYTCIKDKKKKHTYYWGNIILPPIKLKTIHHLYIFVLQILKSTPDCINWGTYCDLCPKILTNELCITKKYIFEIFYFKYKTKIFAIHIRNGEISLYTYRNSSENLTPLEQIPTEILKLCTD